MEGDLKKMEDNLKENGRRTKKRKEKKDDLKKVIKMENDLKKMKWKTSLITI
jgi:hypothetical protein